MQTSLMTPEQLLGLEQSHLLTIEDNIELLGQKFQCHHEALIPLAKLIRQSENDGIPLRVVSSYRSFEQQVAIWNNKFYQDVVLNLRDGRTVNSQELAISDRVNAILNYSAIPGASRHHWGTDFDVFDASAIDKGYKPELLETEFEAQGPCGNLHHWLKENLAQYDFFKPYVEDLGGIACEPWHISYAPIATPALKEFPVGLLQQQIENSEIGGKEIILGKLNALVEKYVRRISHSSIIKD